MSSQDSLKKINNKINQIKNKNDPFYNVKPKPN